MAYDATEARQEMLEAIAHAADSINAALAEVGVAYEQLDDDTGDRLEAALFRPLQGAYARAKRTHSGFAERAGLPGREFAGVPSPSPGHGAQPLIERAVQHARAADAGLADLQDSMRPVEVGDVGLRAGLTEVRELLAPLPAAARELTRTLGR
jgi:hypothetical protein